MNTDKNLNKESFPLYPRLLFFWYLVVNLLFGISQIMIFIFFTLYLEL